MSHNSINYDELHMYYVVRCITEIVTCKGIVYDSVQYAVQSNPFGTPLCDRNMYRLLTLNML